MRKPLVSAAALSAALAVATAVLAGDDRPPAPQGFGAGGVLVPARLPASVGVVGPDGRDIVCADGRPLTIPRAELLAPPPVPGRREREGSDEGQLAPRCGPDGKAVWATIGP